MKKVAALCFIFMIQVATNMAPIMAACSGYTCILPPVIPGGPGSGGSTPGGSTAKCPLNALKLGACVDLLQGLVHVGLGDPVVNQCCPLIQGVAALEAALCLCTTIRAKVLSLNVLLPIALSLVASCGLSVPPDFKCPAN